MSAPIQNNRIHELLQSRSTQSPNKAAVGFGQILSDRHKVSGHAQTRLQSRNIELSTSDWERVMKGVESASQKGAKESLVLVDDIALIVSIKNRTVITAVEKAQLKDNVFTNIDSAVIV